MALEAVWVFMAEGARFPGAVFAELHEAEEWIISHALTGVLTQYPIGEGVYDWAVRTGKYRPKPSTVTDSRAVGRFTSASMAHYHYEHGVKAT